MELSVIFVLLFAALCHSIWNGIAKSIDDKDKEVITILLNSSSALFFMSLYFFIPEQYPSVFTLNSVVFVAFISGFIHSIYWIFLARMYKTMDMSQAYPIARGLPPILIAVVSFYLVDDRLTLLGTIGVVIASLGVLLNAFPKRGHKFNARNILPAFAVGIIITAYTVIDGYGMRISQHPFQFLSLYGFIEVILSLTILLYKKTTQPLNFYPYWKKLIIGSILNGLAYGLVLWAMTFVQFAYVSAIREISTIFAVLIGVIVFKETAGIKRFVFAGITVLGCAIISIWG